MARLADAELIDSARRRRGLRPGQRERVMSVGIAAAFLAVAIPLAAVPSARSLSPVYAIALILAFAAASLVEFEVGTGMAVPTQLVFVPMLFLLPTGAVPAAVAAGYLVGEGLRAFHSRTRMARPAMLIGSSWFAVGPVLVLMAGGDVTPSWHHWPLYVVAFLAQFGVDTLVTVLGDAGALGVRPRLSLDAVRWAYTVDAMLSPVGVVFAVMAQRRPVAVLAILPLLGVLAWFARDRRAHVDALLDLNRTYRGTALVLGDVIEADDSYTGLHSQNVVELSLAVADRLDVDEAVRREVEFTALLHDVGKLRIPKGIINKPGPLTAEERSLVETHTIEGERMLAAIGGFLSRVGVMVRACHERYDGAGYPDGLRGAEIPIAARIVFCCDAYDAMTSDRPYRSARSHEAALHELAAEAGRQFDPAPVAALCAVVRERLARASGEPAGAAAAERPARPRTLAPAPPEADISDHVAEALRDRERVERVRERALVAPAASGYLAGGAFAAFALALPFWSPTPLLTAHTLGMFAGLVAAYAFVYGINFRLGPGSAIPAQLAFVPMLVLLPPALIPLAVGLGILARSGWDPDAATCPARERPFVLLIGGWYTAGPALVLLATSGAALEWDRLAAAIALQLVIDAAVNVARVHVVLGFPLESLARALAWTYAADLALTPIGFTIAASGQVGTVPAIGSGIALAGFLGLLAWERNRQLAHTEDLTDAYSEAAERARRDAVTGLPNRLAWDETLAAVPPGRPAAVVLLDVNNLKGANDSRGHTFGDLLLAEVAQIVRACAPPEALAARIGGDEFGVLLATADAGTTVDRLNAHFDSHPGLDGYRVDASIGHAATPPHATIAAAIDAADRAAYADKPDAAASRRIA